jgi:hypothetical protein
MLKPAFKWLFFLLIFTACNHRGESVHISGILPDGMGTMLVLQEMDTKEIHSLDSVEIGPGGKFSFIRAINEPGFWLLKAPTGRILVLLVHPGDDVSISGKFSGFPDHTLVNGPEDAVRLNEFFRQTRPRERLVDSLEMLLLAGQDSDNYYQLTRQVDSMFRLTWEKQRSLEKAYIDRDPASLGSLVVLNYAFGRNPVLNPDSDFAWYLKTDSALQKACPGNRHAVYHHQRVEALKVMKR